MKSVLTLLNLLALLMPLSSMAISEKDFCNGFASFQNQYQSQGSSSVSILKAIQILISPRSLIKVGRLNELQGSKVPDSKVQDRVIYVNLDHPQVNPNDHEATLSQIQKTKIEITKLSLYQELLSVHDAESCTHLVTEKPDQYKAISDYLDLYLANQELLESIQQRQSFDTLMKRLKSYQKRGWQIKTPETYYDLVADLETHSSYRQIMLISHADSLGRLYDSQKNLFPKGFFSNLPPRISRIIQYSCHSEKVAEYYQIPELKNHFEYFFPRIKDGFAEIFSDRIPVMSIRGMLKLDRNPVKVSLASQNCYLKLEKSIPDHLALSLNDHLLAYSTSMNRDHLGTIVPFYCDLLAQEKNLIKVFYMDSAEKTPLGEFSMSIVTESGKNHRLDVKEYLSSDRKRHLLTLGTVGGPL